MQWCHLCALVEFMYAGVVNVAQNELPTFLQTAESLHILGLTDAPRLHKDGKQVKVTFIRPIFFDVGRNFFSR